MKIAVVNNRIYTDLDKAIIYAKCLDHQRDDGTITKVEYYDMLVIQSKNCYTGKLVPIGYEFRKEF